MGTKVQNAHKSSRAALPCFLSSLECGEAFEGVVEREQLVIGRGAGDFEFIQVEVLGAGAAALAAFAPGAGDDDATHAPSTNIFMA